MKYISTFLSGLFVLLLVGGLFPLMAQQSPTLTHAYNPNPQPGTTMTITRVNTGAITQGASGAGITWNFASLSSFNVKTGTFVLPNATPHAAAFPGATTAVVYTPGIEYGSFTANYEFFTINNTGLTKNGFVNNASTPIAVNYSDPKTLMPYPFTYGNSHIDNFTANYSSGPNSVTEAGNFTVTADGYGSLVLPYGAINNVLRVRIVENFTQTIAGFPPFEYVVETYAWFHPRLAYPIFSIISETVNGSPQPSVIARYIQIPNFDDSIPDIVSISPQSALQTTQLYPNPVRHTAQLRFTLTQSAPVVAELYNLSGKMVAEVVNSYLPAGSHSAAIAAHQLPKGLYVLHLKAATHTQAIKLLVE